MGKPKALFACDVCGRDGFVNLKGVATHKRSHATKAEENATQGTENAQNRLESAMPPVAHAETVQNAGAPTDDATAQAIAEALKGEPSGTDAIRLAADAKKPAGRYHEPAAPGDRKVDGPPVTPREELDPLSKRIGATEFRMGTENRFNWSREGDTEGPRHHYTRMYYKERVLVDVYPDRSRGVEREVAQKTRHILAHNAAEPKDAWGYLPFVKSEGIPSVEDCQRAVRGECVPLRAKPVVAA